MNPIRLVTLSALIVVTAAAACAKKPPIGSGTVARPIESAPSPPPPPPLDAASPAPVDRELNEDELFARKPLAELNAERPLGPVFFGLDDTAIGEAGRATLQRNADWLRRWTSTLVTIEGHCDQRGTSEYNLALGERRAHAVREYLVSLGIDRARLSVVSKGEESPVCTDPNEQCWSQNRHAQSIITAK